MGKKKRYPKMGTKAYARAVDKGYKEGGLTNTKDRTSPHYSGTDRDVTKRGMDPFEPKAYRGNKAIARRVGWSELSDDQSKAMAEDENNVKKEQSSRYIDKLMGKKSGKLADRTLGQGKATGKKKGKKKKTARKEA